MESPRSSFQLPKYQTQLLLHQPRQPYEPFHEGSIPHLQDGELLVEVLAVGLNPIDWKSAHFGFALPQLPCLNGREFVGRVVAENTEPPCRLSVGDLVLAVSTDYRDFRKSAFQEYAVVCCFNAIKIPTAIDPYQVASLGVAFVTASIALGVCLGIPLPARGKFADGLDLLSVAQSESRDNVPSDCWDEVFGAMTADSRPRADDWVLIYGASSVTAQLCIQIAKMAGLRVIGVVDRSKHQERLEALGADILVDRSDLDLAAQEVVAHTQGSLRFAVDVIGKETSQWCQRLLESCNEKTTGDDRGHLVCLSGSPPSPSPSVRVHQVPVKLFHENEILGCKLSYWLYHSLKAELLAIPETRVVDGGLGAVNSCLDQMRKGDVSGTRLVVKLR